MYSGAGLAKHSAALTVAAAPFDTSGPFEYAGKLIGGVIGATLGGAVGTLYGGPGPGTFWGAVIGGCTFSKAGGNFMRRFDSPYAGNLY